jgi:MYXO-CTERM domain-containing protein
MAIVRNGSFWLAAGAVGLTLFAGPGLARAAASSSATASNLTFALYDLNPADDLLPSYQLGTTASTNAVGVFAAVSPYAGFLGSGDTLAHEDAQANGDVERTVNVGGVVVSASSVGGVMSASGSAIGTPVLSYYSAVSALGSYSTSWPTDVTLSPQSALVMSVWAEASAAVDVTCPSPDGLPVLGASVHCLNEEAYASVSLQLWSQYANVATSATLSEDDQLKVGGSVATHVSIVLPEDGSLPYPTWTVDPAVDEQAGRWLSVVFVNISDAPQLAKLALTVSASGTGMSLVPETATANMMALGLGGLAVVALRRRQRT